MRASRLLHKGIMALFAEEMRKVPSYIGFRVRERVQSGVKLAKFVAGEDVYVDEATREARRKHKEMYNKILAEQQKAEKEKQAMATAGMTRFQKWRYQFQQTKQQMREATSMKAGQMALLQHCTTSHAAEVAMEQNIDVKNVKMAMEKRQNKDGLGVEEVVVGYINAPSASEEQVQVFAAALQQACPVARRMQVEWRHGAGEAPVGPSAGGPEFTSVSGMTTQEGFPAGTTSQAGEPIAVPTPSQTENKQTPENQGVDSAPLGTPGERRWSRSSRNFHETRGTGKEGGFASSSSSYSSRDRGFDDNGDEFSLPGIKKKSNSTPAENDNNRF